MNSSYDGALSAFYYEPFHPLKSLTIRPKRSSLVKVILSKIYSCKQECYTRGVE
jgi:hypothetical protein